MQGAKAVVSRIEFRTNLMRADAETIPLGYLVEATWRDGGRWLGMIYRPTLTPNEIREVNFDTWAELSDPDAVLGDMFERARRAKAGSAGEALADSFGCLNALHVYVTDADSDFAEGLGAVDATAAGQLLERLNRFQDALAPSFKARVLKFFPKGKDKAAPGRLLSSMEPSSAAA